MPVSRSKYHLVSMCLAVFTCSVPLLSQDNTLYFMHPVPQAIHTNPALYYGCKIYVEMPVLSGVRYSYANTGFGYHDAMHYGSGTNSDSLIIDMDNLDRKLKKRNYLRNDQSVNILGAGFEILDKYYLHFNISNFTETRIGFPGDLISLKDGNWDIASGQPREIDLSGLGVNGTNYFQVAAGVSTEIMRGIYVGITLKYLKGTSNISSRRTDLMIQTEGDPIRVSANSDYSIRTSFPMQVEYDDQGFVSSIDLSRSFSNIPRDFILNKNNGGAIDLGVIYEYDEQLTLAASIIDLGLIRWGSNIYRFDANAGVDFMGFDLRAYTASGGSTDFLEALIDSVAESFQFETSERPYWSTLSPKIYTGASYQLYPKIRVSALVKTEFFDLRPHLSLTLAGMYSPLPFLHGTLSYSIMNNKLLHLGFGLALGGKGAQFYLVSDHIPWRWVRDTGTGAIWPYNARTANIRLGVNLVFGCQELDRNRSRHTNRPNPRKPSRYCPAYL
jgi:hypothetical protein